MPDAPSDYSRWYDYFQSWFDYFHPTFRCARGGCFARSRGGCQGCGYGRAEHAHHWALRYPPPEATTPDDLTGFCRGCHRVITLLRQFLSVGGDVGRFLSIVEAALAEAGESVPRTGRALRLRGGYGARVAGRTRPLVGELLKVTLRSGAWSYMVVTAVVGGVPGRWRVLTSWPKASERCANRRAVAPPAAAASGRNASDRRPAEGRSGCA